MQSSSWYWRLLGKFQNHEEDCANLCGLLRKAEFYNWMPNLKLNFNYCRSNYCKVQLFWEGHKNCAIFLMVLTFTYYTSKPWGRLHKFLWPSQKSWTLSATLVFVLSFFYMELWGRLDRRVAQKVDQKRACSLVVFRGP